MLVKIYISIVSSLEPSPEKTASLSPNLLLLHSFHWGCCFKNGLEGIYWWIAIQLPVQRAQWSTCTPGTLVHYHNGTLVYTGTQTHWYASTLEHILAQSNYLGKTQKSQRNCKTPWVRPLGCFSTLLPPKKTQKCKKESMTYCVKIHSTCSIKGEFGLVKIFFAWTAGVATAAGHQVGLRWNLLHFSW